MGFPAPKFTDAGKQLQLKAIAGQKIQFKSMVIGDGELGDKSIKDLTELIHRIKKINITSANIVNSMLEIIAVFDNKDVVDPFYFREIGIVASELNTDDEILYCYTNCGDDAEKIESIEVDYEEKHVKIVVNVGDADNVNVIIQPGAYVTQTEFSEKMVTKLENADILNDFDGYINWLSRTSGTAEQKRKLRPSLNIDKLDERYAKSSQAPAFLEIGSSIMDESEDTVLDSNISRNRIWLAEVIASGATQTCNCTGFLFNDGQNHFQGGFSALYEGKGTSGKVPANIIIEFDYNSSTGALKNVSIKGYYQNSSFATTSLAIGTLYAVI